MATTTMDACSADAFPFTFYDANGTAVSGVLNDDGLCTFPTANCGLNVPIDDCCQAKPDLTNTGDNYMFIAFAIILLPMFYIKYFSKTAEQRTEYEEKQKEKVPFWVDSIPLKMAPKIFGYGLMAYILLQIMVPIFMRTSIQANMDVSSRIALLSAEAFIVPYTEIFQFIEDIVLVRVNYALGSGNKSLTNQLVHVGIAGCLVTGIIAAIVGTILGAIPESLSALTNPGLSNDQELYPGCEFIVDSADAVRPYWLMEVWAIPGTQLGLVLSGFMFGAVELHTLGWLGSIALAMIPLIWFLKVDSSENTLLLLASAEFTAAWMLPFLAIVYLMSPLAVELRERTGVTLQFSKLYSSFFEESSRGAQEDAVEVTEINHDNKNYGSTQGPEDVSKVEEGAVEQAPDIPPPPSSRHLLIEGLKIMVMDVAIQFCISLSIYLALLNDAAEGYKLTALQSALPTYGIAYALGMGIIVKVVGPQLLARKQFDKFSKFATLSMVCVFLLVPLIIGTVVPFRTEMAYDYGDNACAYAKDDQCLPFFTHIFGPNSTGGQFTLPFTFDAFPIGASIEAVFFVLRAILLACVDLGFMLESTAVAVVIYIPAIVVASLVAPFGGHAISYFVAMYIPQAILCVLFTFRIQVLLRRMQRGEKGSWSSRASLVATSGIKIESQAA